MYIADTYNNRIRKVTVSTSSITTIAGTGTGSYSGDGAAATSATLYYLYGVVLDSSGFRYTFFVTNKLINNNYILQVMFTSLIIIIIVSVR